MGDARVISILTPAMLVLAALAAGGCVAVEPGDTGEAGEAATRSSAGMAVLGDEDPFDPQWDRYHTSEQADALLTAWASRWPELTELYSIGQTLDGSPLMVLEITAEATGSAADKPAYYYDGNIHAGELTGAEVALHFAWHVLSRYGDDERVTALLDSRALYVRPKFNPDGADIALTTPQSLRSTPRPYDEDGDGLLDEDPGNDLDGDGHLTRMRIADPDGGWYPSPDDPRAMLRRPGADEAAAPPAGVTFYDVVGEGVDDDGDGRRDEDGIGGIDMNRNFPRNWGMEFEQRGAGPFPLSEPETRATVEFLSAHRNVTGIFHGHTSGGFVYRLPSTTAWSDFPASDQELILELSARYEETTEQPARPSYTNPEVHRHGTLISWGYWDLGVVGFVPEFWGGFGIDDDGDVDVDELERLRFHDEELEGDYFTEWAPFDHPELGPVEIGGWHTKLTGQNPPPELLRREVELYVSWMLWLAERSPRVEIRDVVVTPGVPRAGPGTGSLAGATEPGAGAPAPDSGAVTLAGTAEPAGTGTAQDDTADGDLYRVRVEVENVGWLPTNVTRRALDAEIAVPVRAFVELRDAELVEGTARAELGHLAGTREAVEPGGPGAPTSTTGSVEYLVRITGASPVMVLQVVSEKGGTVRREVALGAGRPGQEPSP